MIHRGEVISDTASLEGPRGILIWMVINVVQYQYGDLFTLLVAR